MTFEALLKEVIDGKITRITSHSKAAGPGVVFVAIQGTVHDAHEFLPEVAKAGVAVSVGELPPKKEYGNYIQVPNSRLALALLAAEFYKHPSKKMKVVGVTGTSGKTTSVHLVESILKAAGEKVGVLGTISFRFGDQIIPATHTTPGPVELQKILAEMRDKGCTAVVMEVSSHALKQHRTDGIAFDAMIFTNLTPEHMDFHPDMEDYYQSKLRLFTEYAEHSVQMGKHPAAAVHVDDSFGQRMLGELNAAGLRGFSVMSYGTSARAQVSGKDLKVSVSGIRGNVGRLEIESPLIGSFNISNILGAIAAAQGMGLSAKAISTGVRNLQSVAGRLERVASKTGIHVLVDYAHKSDALEKVLTTLGDLKKQGRLITVMGCGGDRDRTKRPVMGKLAATMSDFTVITSDNPRTEDPIQIIGEIVAGILPLGLKDRYKVEVDRKKAIFAALDLAVPGDLVLIAGKGHEDYQIIGHEKVHFDDREVAAEALAHFGK
ncbi:UDP-N-acetylmuramoyl-L-alanyl-D-glutamate--2,6-diaminopimelate ligase [bacterium]|jgi:UDP-N-acetylmuramoyl-L-alanyl-D-glutamate--2,6-diaminopimelate ligase|nr:UDP-N-acetylmuramoyl-L-alanyl-D-glutamate--2,6-diaminopimelate ligase [bacterium]